jgi:flagellar biosynthesis protein FlhA
MSEVAARFILDAMPGKQMGVDAELSAGLINEEQARRRRRQIEAEADFYGAMDGASKFLRGDAVAAIVILVVNIFGGLYVGLVQYGWPLSETVDLFTRLTIGDGLVTQIPAFIVSVAAAMMVSRGTARGNLGETMLSQVFSRPVVLVITAAFLAMLGFTSLPKGPLLLMGVGCGGLAWVLSRREQDAPPPSSEGSEGKPAAVTTAGTGQNVNELLLIDAMRLELGFALVSLTDASADGGLLRRIATMRKQIASEMGLIVPPIHIRDNLDLEARGYAIFIRGSKVASGRLYPNQLLAVGGDEESVQLMGRPTNEPIFGASAMWINQSQRGQAEAAGYTVVSGGEALMTHLNEVVKRHAPELLSRQRVVRLLENLKATEANLVQEVTSKLTYAQIQKVLQNLLSERVSIRNMETILEALCDSASRSTQVEALTEDVRAAMAGSMCQALCDANGKLPCVGLRPELEEELGAYVSEEPRWSAASIPPELARKVALVVSGELARLQRQGRPPVVICSPPLRPALSKLLKPSLPEAVVLGYNEIDSVEVESVATVGI